MILSALSPAELVNVISTENANMLKTVKGIGLKTAQRVIVDLKDKIKTMSGSAGGGASAGLLLQPANAEVQEEAVSALTMLGFAAAPSQKVVLAILKEDAGCSGRKGYQTGFETFGSMKQQKIYMKAWLDAHGRAKAVDTDEWYLDFANQLLPLVADSLYTVGESGRKTRSEWL